MNAWTKKQFLRLIFDLEQVEIKVDSSEKIAPTAPSTNKETSQDESSKEEEESTAEESSSREASNLPTLEQPSSSTTTTTTLPPTSSMRSLRPVRVYQPRYVHYRNGLQHSGRQ